jgi:hypothetical protein
MLVFAGVAAVLIGLLGSGRARLGRFSRRRVFVLTGVLLIAAAGALFVALTIVLSLRAMPV